MDIDAAEANLDCVQITPEHIRANGTLHTTPFAGIAELIDNAVDSGAKNVRIENRFYEVPDADGKLKQHRHIVVIDDGAGMNRAEALKTIMVGYSLKRGDSGAIGQFGNGLKSGSMRVGGTMLMVTRKRNEFTALLISLKYLDTLQDHKCYVPIITYTLSGAKELQYLIDVDEPPGKHEKALERILQYSPFPTEELLKDFMMTELTYLKNQGGTCISISDLKRLENNDYELSYQAGDLVTTSRDTDEPVTSTLSSWLQTLYFTPNVIITIQSKQVRLLSPTHTFAAPRWTHLAQKGLTLFANREKQNIERQIQKLTNEKLPFEQEKAKLESKQRSTATSTMDQKAIRPLLSKLHDQINTYTEQINRLHASMTQTVGKVSGGRDIKVYFGIDVHHRGNPRIMFYSNGRRICVHPLSTKKKEQFLQYMGVVALVNIPATLLHTKQNREHYEIPSEFDEIVKKIRKTMVDYFERVDKKYKTAQFWSDLSYSSSDPWDVPSLNKPGIAKKLFDLCGGWRQCGECGVYQKKPWDETAEDTLEYKLCLCKQNEDKKCIKTTPAEARLLEIRKLDMNAAVTHYEGADPAAKKAAARKPLGKVKEEDRGRSRSVASAKKGGKGGRTPARRGGRRGSSSSSEEEESEESEEYSRSPERPKRHMAPRDRYTVTPAAAKKKKAGTSTAKKTTPAAMNKLPRSAMDSPAATGRKRNPDITSARRALSPFSDDSDETRRKKAKKARRMAGDCDSDDSTDTDESMMRMREDSPYNPTSVFDHDLPPSRQSSGGHSSHMSQSTTGRGSEMVAPKEEPTSATRPSRRPETPNKGVPLFASSVAAKEEVIEEDEQLQQAAAGAAGAARGERRNGEAPMPAAIDAPPAMKAEFAALREKYCKPNGQGGGGGMVEKRKGETNLQRQLAGLKRRKLPEQQRRETIEDVEDMMGGRMGSRDARREWDGGDEEDNRRRDYSPRYSRDYSPSYGAAAASSPQYDRASSAVRDYSPSCGAAAAATSPQYDRVAPQYGGHETTSAQYGRTTAPAPGSQTPADIWQEIEEDTARKEKEKTEQEREADLVEKANRYARDTPGGVAVKAKTVISKHGYGDESDLSDVSLNSSLCKGRTKESYMPPAQVRASLEPLSKEQIIAKYEGLVVAYQKTVAERDAAIADRDAIAADRDSATRALKDVTAERDDSTAVLEEVMRESERDKESIAEGLRCLAEIKDDAERLRALHQLSVVMDPVLELTQLAEQKKEEERKRKERERKAGGGGSRPSSSQGRRKD